MKKHLFIILALLLTLGSTETDAQSFLKRLKKGVEKEVVNKMNKLTKKEQKNNTDRSKQQSETTHKKSQSQRKNNQLHYAEEIDVMIEYGPITGKVNGHEWVDLGLPSGTRWATCNIGAKTPEQSGNLYAWGEISTKTSYTQDNSKYQSKEKSDFSGDKSNDAATAKWGKGWRMPTEEEFNELLFYCNWKYEKRGGRWGSTITSSINNNSIFLPVTGYKEGAKLYDASGNGMYWTSTPKSDQWNNGAYMYQFGGALGEVSIGDRSYGYAIRAVTDYDTNTEIPSSGEINGYKYVDLGLPSGIKWATHNVGSDAIDQDGKHYSWGDIIPYTEDTPNKNKMYGKKIGDISGNTKYDVAKASWGGTWRIPTENEFKELIDNCIFEWTTIGRRSGMKVTSKTNGNYIFLPATGVFMKSSDSYGRANDINKQVLYWTSTPTRGNYSNEAYALSIYKTHYIISSNTRFYGLSVRPVSD